MSFRKAFNSTVLVGALGYFVDIYDLVLFSIVRVSSLRAIGVPDDQLLDVGVFLINSQMTGMLVGGVLWGILGDKRGRLSVLFGSIALYSIANILNAFVTSVPLYGALRFTAGVGLAGELGAAITLVSEILPKETRGYGTTIVASVGICGAVVAALIGDAFPWWVAYIVGGCLGLALLALRIGIYESGMFDEVKKSEVRRGDLKMLFANRDRATRYIACILVGVPIWYVIGILITFSPEIAQALGVTGPIAAGKSIMYCYIGLAVGDLASGLLSQWLQSRRRVILAFLTLTAASVAAILLSEGISPAAFYALCVAVGFATGYWAMFVTVASEQFGTNLRATVTTTSPNFVRGSVVPLTLLFRSLIGPIGTVESAALVGVLTLGVAVLALRKLPECFGRDLDFTER